MKRDLMKVYAEVVSRYNCRCQLDAYRETVRHSAPRFYVDPRWAVQRLAPMMRGDFSGLSGASPMTRQMYFDLMEKTIDLSRQSKFEGRSLHYIVRHAVLEPAPRFYIAEKRMAQIWRESARQRNGLRRCKTRTNKAES